MKRFVIRWVNRVFCMFSYGTLGAVTVLASGVGLARVRPLAWYVVAALAAVVVWSSWAHVRRSRAARRAREDSEGRRLQAFLGVPDERR